MDKMNGYALSRNFWDFAFENTGKIKATHVAIYFFAIEHCNRLGWKKNFGLPTSMVLEAITVKSYSVYKKAFDDLVEFGFFEIVQYSKNQYSSNIIALKENCKANCKALDKAFTKHIPKHSAKHCSSTVQSIDQSIVSIDKQLNNITIKQLNNRTSNQIFYDTQKLSLVLQSEDSWLESIARKYKCSITFATDKILDFIIHLEAQGEESKTLQDAKSHYDNWFRIQKDLKLKTKNNATNRKAGSPIPQDELLQAVAKAYGYTNTNT